MIPKEEAKKLAENILEQTSKKKARR